MAKQIFLPVAFSEAGVGQGKLGIVVQSTLEDFDGAVDVLRLLIFLQVASAAQIEVIGCGLVGAMRLQSVALLLAEFQVQSTKSAVDDAVLQGERVVGSGGNRVGA